MKVQRAIITCIVTAVGMVHTFKFYIKVFLSDGQGAVWLAILYGDRSCCLCFQSSCSYEIKFGDVHWQGSR